MLLKPVFLVARPVEGLKALPPAANVVRTVDAFDVLLSVETIFNSDTIRFSVALSDTAAVLAMVMSSV